MFGKSQINLNDHINFVNQGTSDVSQKKQASMMKCSADMVSKWQEEEIRGKHFSLELKKSDKLGLAASYEVFRDNFINSMSLSKEKEFDINFRDKRELNSSEELTCRANFINQLALCSALDPEQASKLMLADTGGNTMGVTQIGNTSTSFDTVPYEYPAFVDQDEVLVPRLQAHYFDSQYAVFQNLPALVGIMETSERGATGKPMDAPSYELGAFSCGYFGGSISLDMNKLSLQRNINSIGGNQADFAISRSIAQLSVKLAQLMNSIAYKTKVDNGYNYSLTGNSSNTGFMAYGRPSANTFEFSEPPLLDDGGADLKVNPDSTFFQELMYFVTNVNNGLVLATKRLLEGFAVNSQTKNAMAQQIVNNNNTPQAISFGAGLRYEIDADRLYDSTTWLKDFKIMESEGTAKIGTNDFGAIDQVEYYLESGYMIPIWEDYNAQPMNGMFIFMPNERVTWLSNMQGIPANLTPMSDPRSTGIRVVSSLDSHSDDPAVFIEFTTKTAYVNPISASDYILELIKTV